MPGEELFVVRQHSEVHPLLESTKRICEVILGTVARDFLTSEKLTLGIDTDFRLVTRIDQNVMKFQYVYIKLIAAK